MYCSPHVHRVRDNQGGMTVDVGVEGLVAELDQELKHERRRNYQGIGALAS